MSNLEISTLVTDLIVGHNVSADEIAERLGVSNTSVSRWQRGEANPRPQVEGELRKFHREVRESVLAYRVPGQLEIVLESEEAVRKVLGQVLLELREAFHRHGRYSGRRDALEEVTKLLVAHVTSVGEGGQGLTMIELHKRSTQKTSTAGKLREMVSAQLTRHLPPSLSGKLRQSATELSLADEEGPLAEAILAAMRPLVGLPGLVVNGTIAAVDLLNDVFGTFLASSFHEEKELGQYLTPTEVVRFMVSIALHALTAQERVDLYGLAPGTDFGYVLDPCCGVGSLLAEFTRSSHATRRHSIGTSEEPEWYRRLVGDTIVGIDKSSRMLQFCQANLAMFGVPVRRLCLADGLALPGDLSKDLSGRVGLILTNPPFGAEVEVDRLVDGGTTAFKGRSGRKISSEVAFLSQYLAWLRPGGQLVAVVPDSVLTNRGIYQEVREQLADAATILSVISLPAPTFGMSGTTTKTSILHLRRKPTKGNPKTFVGICDDIGYRVVSRGTQRQRVRSGPGDLPRILDGFLGRSTFANVAKVESIHTSHRWDAQYHIGRAEADSSSTLRESYVEVSAIAAVVNDHVDPRRLGKPFKYIEISGLSTPEVLATAGLLMPESTPSRARQRVAKGDVLVSTVRPERGAVAVVPADLDGAICTTGIVALRTKVVDPFLLACVLRSPYCTAQLSSQATGIAYPTANAKDILSIRIPTALVGMKELAHAATSAHLASEKARNEREQLQQRVSVLLSAPQVDLNSK